MNCALSANTEHKYAPWQALLRTHKASQNEGLIQSPQEPSLDCGFCVFLVALLSSQCAKDTAVMGTHDLDHSNVPSDGRLASFKGLQYSSGIVQPPTSFHGEITQLTRKGMKEAKHKSIII